MILYELLRTILSLLHYVVLRLWVYYTLNLNQFFGGKVPPPFNMPLHVLRIQSK